MLASASKHEVPGLLQRLRRCGAGTRFFRRKKGLHEGVIERIDIAKILAPVVLGLTKDIILDEVEHEVAKIGTMGDAPRIEHGFGQRAILVQSINTQSIQKLRTGDMLAALGSLGIFLAELLDRLVQTMPDKRVGFPAKPGIFLVDELDYLVKIQVLHI